MAVTRPWGCAPVEGTPGIYPWTSLPPGGSPGGHVPGDESLTYPAMGYFTYPAMTPCYPVMTALPTRGWSLNFASAHGPEPPRPATPTYPGIAQGTSSCRATHYRVTRIPPGLRGKCTPQGGRRAAGGREVPGGRKAGLSSGLRLPTRTINCIPFPQPQGDASNLGHMTVA